MNKEKWNWRALAIYPFMLVAIILMSVAVGGAFLCKRSAEFIEKVSKPLMVWAGIWEE